MGVGFYVKYLYQILMKLSYVNRFKKDTQISNLNKIRPVGTESFHADRETHRQGRTDRRTDNCDETNSCFSQFCERA